MTDKEKILAKIESLLNKTNYEPFTDEVLGRIQSLKELKSYIDSMQEEPVSEDLKYEITDYINNHFSECEDGVLLSDAHRSELQYTDAADIARHFAKWQKEHLWKPALRQAVEIAREEIYEWLNENAHLYIEQIETIFGRIKVFNTDKLIKDLKQAMKNE